MITELLNCARPAKLNLQPYDIHMVLKDILESAKTKINLQKIKVTKNFTPLEVPAKGGHPALQDYFYRGSPPKPLY